MANLAEKFGEGLTPIEFVDKMSVNEETFRDWYTRFEWEDEADQEFFESLQDRDDIRCLILAADWCGDVVRNIPVVFRALEVTQMPVDVLIMEDHLDLMDQFLTLGGRSIPKVLFADMDGQLRAEWGPRPEPVQTWMRKFKEENPDREAPDYKEKIKEVYAKMAQEYGEGTAYHRYIIDELRGLLSKI